MILYVPQSKVSVYLYSNDENAENLLSILNNVPKVKTIQMKVTGDHTFTINVS